jgi:hypothetical protein
VFVNCIQEKGRAQWPRGPRHELSSLARTLESWVRIPHKAWMLVCDYSVLFCVLAADIRRADPRPLSPTHCVIGFRNRKSGQGPTEKLQSHGWMDGRTDGKTDLGKGVSRISQAALSTRIYMHDTAVSRTYSNTSTIVSTGP